MDCITSIQKAIDYMETNLLEDITYEDVARNVFMSSYHFHRLFSMLTGITANEYIRNRRLSKAGQELTVSDIKVIDVALKYGYDTPESFTKAFTRFHGIAPSAARKSGMQLHLYNRLILKLIVEGGSSMNYRIVEKKPFQLVSKVKSFPNEITSEPDNQDVSDFWDECGKEGVFDVLNQYGAGTDLYGSCSPISKESDFFDYGIGKIYNGNGVPEGFRLWEITQPLWAVFSCYGTNGDCISDTWNRIFTEFLPGSEYDMLDAEDFELYPAEHPNNLFCEIWIPVKKK